ncbi:hypothetical protein FACS1894158_00040 [Betaproteobacteria bacterium]|nr:hypothetical protein FACS1894158_00040 [Betaproteobacteria bacterium]
MLAGLVEWQDAILQQLDKVRTRYVEHIGGFLWSHLGVDRNDLYCVSLGQLGQDVNQ